MTGDRTWAQYVERLPPGDRVPFDEQWAEFQKAYSTRRQQDGPPIAWCPAEEQLEHSNLASFMRELGFRSYTELHQWSVNERAAFWEKVIPRLGIVFSREPDRILDLSGGVQDPIWLPGARMNCTDSCFSARAGQAAVISGEEEGGDLRVTSYGELSRLVNRFAKGLRRHGFAPGDGIALYMPMTLECVVAYLGSVRAGCRVVSIADSFSPPEVRRRMEIAGAMAIVTVDRYQRAGRTIEMYEKVREAGVPRAIVISAEGDSGNQLRQGDLQWDDLLSDDVRFEAFSAGPYDVTNVLFSSGTTGEPKAIPWTHLTPIKCGMDGHFHQDIRHGDVVAWPTNIGWMMGPWLIYATLLNRATMALFQGAPTGEAFIDFLKSAGVTVLGVVPSMVRAWRVSRSVQWGDLERVRVFSSTGEPSSRQDYLWLMSRGGYRAPIIEYLGGTEIGGGHLTGTVVQAASPATFTTPALGIDAVILDENGSPVAEGEMGELYLIPPAIGLSQTLLNRDHDDVYHAGCPTGPRGEVLRRHGDQIGRLHGGFYRAHGRADDTMNLGGIKVSSLELERVMDSHDAVYESAAVAVQPGGEGAEQLVAFIVLDKPTSAEDLATDLQKMIGKELNPLFKIRDLVIRESLPRTASNKLMRRELRARYDTSRR